MCICEIVVCLGLFVAFFLVLLCTKSKSIKVNLCIRNVECHVKSAFLFFLHFIISSEFWADECVVAVVLGYSHSLYLCTYIGCNPFGLALLCLLSFVPLREREKRERNPHIISFLFLLCSFASNIHRPLDSLLCLFLILILLFIHVFNSILHFKTSLHCVELDLLHFILLFSVLSINSWAWLDSTGLASLYSFNYIQFSQANHPWYEKKQEKKLIKGICIQVK